MNAYQPLIDAEASLHDGRRIGYAIWGDLSGRPAVLCHGAPASRMFAPDPIVTAKTGLRLITVDRPGYGRSSPKPERTFVDWVEDLIQLLDQLEVDTVSMVAHSAGGPYALACLSLLPRVDHVVLVSTIAPLDGGDAPATFSDDPSEVELVELARRDPDQARAIIAGAAGWLAEDPDRFLDLPRPAPDTQLLQQPNVKTMFMSTIREAVRQGLDGYATDEVLCRRPWGFELGAIGRQVSIWHGAQDVGVTPAHASVLAGLMPQAQVHIDPTQGHGLILARWSGIATELVA